MLDLADTLALARKNSRTLFSGGNSGNAGNRPSNPSKANALAHGVSVPTCKTRLGTLGTPEPLVPSVPTSRSELGTHRDHGNAGTHQCLSISVPTVPSVPSRKEDGCGTGQNPVLVPGPAEAPSSDEVEVWRSAFYALSSAEPPCPGFRNREWRSVFDATHAFLEQHAEVAHRLGWSALDLFGVHRVVGARRVDACGALMVGAGALVSAVGPDVIHFMRAQDGLPCGRFFRAQQSPESVLIWEFSA